ncbi:uncharacterized protein [Eurosta solidaginis]|uniref:uncharacterized protein n=1 Tax=Eurosta solidaginis TaxID=178769 RepID=UPI0035312CF7
MNVPKSAETLLKNKSGILVKNMSPGFYCNIGIKTQLNRIGETLNNYNNIIVDVNIDGLPLYRSFRVQVWPILLRLVNITNTAVFTTGIYLGKSKPSSVTQFLAEFTEEVAELRENGFDFNGRCIKFTIRAFVCDAPAKAFLCEILGHTGGHGCPKCTQVGHKINGVLTYSTEAGTLVSNEDFLERKYPDKHAPAFRNNLSPLENIGIDMVKQVPIDVMHLIDLGVMRKFIMRIISNESNYKFRKEAKINISSKLLALRPYITKEFVRKPRSLVDIANWKATEFRMFHLSTMESMFLKTKFLEMYTMNSFFYIVLAVYCFVLKNLAQILI